MKKIFLVLFILNLCMFYVSAEPSLSLEQLAQMDQQLESQGLQPQPECAANQYCSMECGRRDPDCPGTPWWVYLIALFLVLVLGFFGYKEYQKIKAKHAQGLATPASLTPNPPQSPSK